MSSFETDPKIIFHMGLLRFAKLRYVLGRTKIKVTQLLQQEVGRQGLGAIKGGGQNISARNLQMITSLLQGAARN